MNSPYDSSHTPPAPILEIALAAPGESPHVGPLLAMVDTGSDGTLVPTDYLERAEAIGLDEAILHGIAGGSRRVQLNKFILLLDGPRHEIELFERRPNWR